MSECETSFPWNWFNITAFLGVFSWIWLMFIVPLWIVNNPDDLGEDRVRWACHQLLLAGVPSHGLFYLEAELADESSIPYLIRALSRTPIFGEEEEAFHQRIERTLRGLTNNQTAATPEEWTIWWTNQVLASQASSLT